MVIYTYSLSTDFPDGLVTNQFHKILKEANTISVQFFGLNVYDDVVEIIYESSLSGAEEIELNSIISSYIPLEGPEKNKFFQVFPSVTSVISLSWTSVGIFKYAGSVVDGLINYVDLIARTGSSLTTYDARVVNTANGQILCSVSGLNNTTYQLNDLGVISNIPEEETILDIQVKRNGVSTIYIQAAVIYAGN